MPRTKRAKKISLTKTTRRATPARKSEMINDIRENVEKYKYLYLLSIRNERNSHLKEIRTRLKPGRLYCTKNRVMGLALGTTPETEVQDNIHHVAKQLSGQRAMLFSDEQPDKIMSMLSSFTPLEFARAGAIATHTVTLPCGSASLHAFSHTMEPRLRSLGIPTAIRDGRIELVGAKVVCEEGQRISAEGAQILKLLDIRMSRFEMTTLSVWDREHGEVKELSSPPLGD